MSTQVASELKSLRSYISTQHRRSQRERESVSLSGGILWMVHFRDTLKGEDIQGSKDLIHVCTVSTMADLE